MIEYLVRGLFRRFLLQFLNAPVDILQPTLHGIRLRPEHIHLLGGIHGIRSTIGWPIPRAKTLSETTTSTMVTTTALSAAAPSSSSGRHLKMTTLDSEYFALQL